MELLVVVAILAMLIAILVPSFRAAMQYAQTAKTRAWMHTLADGCRQYSTQNNGYYPGQACLPSLAGSGGPYTGTQVLAACLLDYGLAGIPSTTNNFQSKYLSGTRSNDLQIFNSFPNTFSDRDNQPMPILYYPSRGRGVAAWSEASNVPGQPGKVEFKEFKELDNYAYTSATTPPTAWHTLGNVPPSGFNPTPFTLHVLDARKGMTMVHPYGTGEFIFIAAGRDRQFGTQDDIRYPDW